jgi:hypothetical protein
MDSHDDKDYISYITSPEEVYVRISWNENWMIRHNYIEI